VPEIYFGLVSNQPPKANSAFHSSGFGKWVPALAGKAKAGILLEDERRVCTVHCVQVKLWDFLRTHAIPEHLRGGITTRRYTNPRLPLLYLTTARRRCCGTSIIPAPHIKLMTLLTYLCLISLFTVTGRQRKTEYNTEVNRQAENSWPLPYW